MIIAVGRTVLFFIHLINFVIVTSVLFSTDEFTKFPSWSVGVFTVQLYSVVESLLQIFLSIKLFNHLTRKLLTLLTLIGLLNVPLLVISLFSMSQFPPFPTNRRVTIFFFATMTNLILMIEASISIFYFFYVIICFIIFANKTYRSAPIDLSDSPFPFSSLPKEDTINGEILFSIAPGSTNHFRRRSVFNDVKQLKDMGVNEIVSCLTTRDYERLGMNTYEGLLFENNIKLVKCPIVDFWIPESVSLYDKKAFEVSQDVLNGNKVLIHCNSGKGRTGLFAGAVYSKIHPNKSGKWYIKYIKSHLKGAFDTLLQRLYFKMYIAHLN
ncbi:hypothetical protein EIN_490000 [Entamoeba invadens IP1]|uniref:Tyrosine specific protein phosphatases domain-containing protein n=1 Tax=Entamoeba invadens IP1 TaxID=370355 RepID=A0A0A1U7D0_ENTIV|nr:hypothetical protein EIN_490000 [Entamoeba invadens IP1]ELP88941.1 hypothetical protein EIN_490000 [Entamoeba invadens IP1]|eukprot:XP_004255712.1 hypothetical protein EIN_490000 [Entamoeba invadens IP1]